VIWLKGGLAILAKEKEPLARSRTRSGTPRAQSHEEAKGTYPAKQIKSSLGDSWRS